MPDKKRGYYICYKTNTEFLGVNKKIDNQVKVLNSYCDCQKIDIPKDEKNVFKSIVWRMPFGSMGRKYEYALDMIKKNDKPDFFYIRFVPLDRRFIKFLEELRRRYDSARVIIEIPTYPYKGELLHNVTMLPFYFKDLFYRGRLKRYVDRIVILTDDRFVYGIPTIRTINGIVIDDIPMASRGDSEDKGKINLIAVANFLYQHGYERCIMGMKEYYENKTVDKPDIYIHMVGEGSELDRYKRLVKQYGLEEHILFYGQKTGDDLGEIYDKADIALGIFGLYKIKIEKSSGLKVREYLARGLPVVSGCTEDAFQGSFPEFYLQVDNDDSVVNMNLIVKFYERLFADGMDRKKMAEKIRNYAKRKVDMSVVMKPVIEYIMGEENNRGKDL